MQQFSLRRFFSIEASYSLTVSVRCPPPNSPFGGALVSTIDSGHLGALYVGEAKEAALVG